MFEYERIVQAVTPYKDKMIVCLESAADYLGLWSGSVYPSDIHVYVEGEMEIPGFICHSKPDNFKKNIIEKNGIYCTENEQTLLDLLEQEDRVDTQVILECLAYYYFTHGEGFNGLEDRMNKLQKEAFDKWRYDAINYYNEE